MSQIPQDWFADVLLFTERLSPEFVRRTPSGVPVKESELRVDLMVEELAETLDAIKVNDLPKIADGLADLIYVAIGTAISYGIDLRPVWAAVHTANCKKVGGSKRPDGKRLKPIGWKPPDIEGILAKQGPISY